MCRTFLAAPIAALALACGTAGEGEVPRAIAVPPCHVTGCSAQLCLDREDVGSTCEWLPEYACYRTARCEPREGLECGWTPTQELVRCLEAARSP